MQSAWAAPPPAPRGRRAEEVPRAEPASLRGQPRNSGRPGTVTLNKICVLTRPEHPSAQPCPALPRPPHPRLDEFLLRAELRRAPRGVVLRPGLRVAQHLRDATDP